MITRKLNELYPNYIISGGIFTDLQTLPVPWKDLQIQKSLDIAYHGNNGQKLISPLLNELEQNTPISQTHRQDVVNTLWALYEKRWTKLYETLLFDYNPIENYRMVEDEDGTNSGTNSNQRTLNTKDKETIDTHDVDALEHDTTLSYNGYDNIEHGGNDTLLKSGSMDVSHNGSMEDDGHGGKDDKVHGFNSSDGVPSDSSATTSYNLRTYNNVVDTTTYNNQSDKTTYDSNEKTTYNSNDKTTGTDTRTIDRDGTDTFDHTGTITDSGSDSETSHRTLTRSGNIGVTTSQQMIESERVLWDFNYFATVFKDINDVLTLMIY